MSDQPEKKDQKKEDDENDVYVNQRSIAYLFGITPRNFAEWNVVPVGTKGREAFYSVKQTIAYARDKWQAKKSTSSFLSKKERVLKLQADKLELEVLEKQKSLFPLELIEAVWSEQIMHFRLKILSLAPRLANQLSVMRSPDSIKKTLKKAVMEALDELSKYSVSEYRSADTDQTAVVKQTSEKTKQKP